MHFLKDNQIEKAFEEINLLLNFLSDKEIFDIFILLKSRYYRLENDEMKGIIDFNNSRLEENQIKSSFLSLIRHIDKIEFSLQVIK